MKEILKGMFIGLCAAMAIFALTVSLTKDALGASSQAPDAQKPHILSYEYNENVTISISNMPCPQKHLVGEYPYGAVALRIDGAALVGCYKKLDEDLLRIQWLGGDTTDLPANAFLVNPDGTIKPMPPATL